MWELTISRCAWKRLYRWLTENDREQACLLGAAKSLDCIDSVIPVQGIEEANRFLPDMDALNLQIHRWAAEGICFRGLIHSHPGGPSEPSDQDIQTMEAWTRAAQMPDLIFGIADIRRERKTIHLWRSELLPDNAVYHEQLVPIHLKWPWTARKWRLSHEKTD